MLHVLAPEKERLRKRKSKNPFKMFKVGMPWKKEAWSVGRPGPRRRSVGRDIFAQCEKEVCKCASGAERSGLRHSSS